MTSTVDAVRTGVYLCAAVAVPLVALLAAAGDLCALLRALGSLCTAPVVLFAEIHSCKRKRRGFMCHCLCRQRPLPHMCVSLVSLICELSASLYMTLVLMTLDRLVTFS